MLLQLFGNENDIIYPDPIKLAGPQPRYVVAKCCENPPSFITNYNYPDYVVNTGPIRSRSWEIA